MNLAELTDYVWKQTDTTEFDLPAVLIESYLDEGFARTIAAENRWPFYEKTWDVSIIIGESTADLDPEVSIPSVLSLVRRDDWGNKLQQIEHTEADLRFGSKVWEEAAEPQWFSFWERKIYFWPQSLSSEDRQYVLRGYRHPVSTFAASGEVDADERLHKPLAHYAISLAYAAQEDEYLEQTYMTRWQRDVELARKAIMDPPKNRPIVMYGNFPRTPIGPRRNWGPGGTNPIIINTP